MGEERLGDYSLKPLETECFSCTDMRVLARMKIFGGLFRAGVWGCVWMCVDVCGCVWMGKWIGGWCDSGDMWAAVGVVDT